MRCTVLEVLNMPMGWVMGRGLGSKVSSHHGVWGRSQLQAKFEHLNMIMCNYMHVLMHLETAKEHV